MIYLIVPIHNEEPFLERCLSSIANQMADDIRVVLINDGSTDKSGEIAKRYADEWAWELITHDKNQGLSTSRNDGLELALNEAHADDWIAFLDSDDELTPEAFSIMRDAIEDHPGADWLQFNHLRHYARIDKTVKKYDNRDGLFDIANIDRCNCWWGAWNKIVRKSAIRHFFSNRLERYGEDGVWMLEHLLDGARIHTVDQETVIHHFENPNSLTKSKTKRELEALDRVQREMLAAHSGPDEPWENIKALVHAIETCQANPIYKAIREGKE